MTQKASQVLIFLLFSALLPTQNIDWQSGRKLTWDDFRAGSNQEFRKSAAYAYTGISYEVSQSSQPNGPVTIRVKAVFNPQKSWKKNEDPGSFVLQHEQLHFDITELFVRKIRKMIAEKVKKSADYEKVFQPEYRRLYNEYNAFQKKYDQETHHSMNKPVQEEYNQLVAEMLGDLQAYSTS